MTRKIIAKHSVRENGDAPSIGHNSRATGPITRIPACHIGRVLDNGKPGMYGAHLLAIKCSKSPGYVLNEKAVRKFFGIGERAFRAGLAILQRQGVLVRRQPNRRDFAVEALVAVAADAFHVSIPDRTLTADSAVVAFGLAVAISPTARRPSEIAKRIGTTSTVATRKALRAAEALGLVVVYHDQFGAIRVGRPGEKHPESAGDVRGVKNVVAINVGAINVGAHSTRKEDHRNRKKNTTLVRGIVVSPKTTVADQKGIDLLDLHDWQEAGSIVHMIDDQAFDHLGVCEEVVSAITAAAIDGALASHGATAPAHFLTAHGVGQFQTLIQAAFSYYYEIDVTAADLLDGICAALAHRMRQGCIIRSLAIVAQPILKDCHAGDFSWVTHHPSQRLGDHLGGWVRWAEGTLLPALEAAGVPFDGDRLTSTRAIERLADLYAKYGEANIERACHRATIEPGYEMTGWAHLLDCAELLSRGSNSK